MSEVKSMACINALVIVNFVIKGIRESFDHSEIVADNKGKAKY